MLGNCQWVGSRKETYMLWLTNMSLRIRMGLFR